MKLYQDATDMGDDLQKLLDTGGEVRAVYEIESTLRDWCDTHDAEIIPKRDYCMHQVILDTIKDSDSPCVKGRRLIAKAEQRTNEGGPGLRHPPKGPRPGLGGE